MAEDGTSLTKTDKAFRLFWLLEQNLMKLRALYHQDPEMLDLIDKQLKKLEAESYALAAENLPKVQSLGEWVEEELTAGRNPFKELSDTRRVILNALNRATEKKED